MAYVLSLPSTCPLDRPFVEPLFIRSRASIISQSSNGTTQHTRRRSQTLGWPLPDDPTRLASRSVLNYLRDFDLTPERRAPSSIASSVYELATEQAEKTQDTVSSEQSAGDLRSSEDSVLPFPPLEAITTEGLFPAEDTPEESTAEQESPRISQSPEAVDASPFRRWLSTLRKRHDYVAIRGGSHAPLGSQSSPQSGHQKSLSMSSSMGILTGVKSAALTLAGTSIAPTSRCGRQGQLHSDNASASYRGLRMSIDSISASTEYGIDGKAWYRSIQRRNIVEEILQSEESYIADMKAMVHVYFTLLASAPTVSPRKKDSIQKSISQILQLHEDLLVELHKVVPSRSEMAEQITPRRYGGQSRHTRWHSADNGRATLLRTVRSRRRFQQSVDMSRSSSPISRSMILTTNTVLNVAKVFDRFMKRFLAYEAYVAYHEIIHEEANSTARIVPAWPAYERGVEALSASVNTLEQKEAFGRKGLTFADLGIKPIQRICKYPLFFADLCKHTPACDDPIVYAELEKVLSRLQETAEEIDCAMDNPHTRHLIESTWILQDRLTFRGVHPITHASTIRHLGHTVLCGALHVAYETPEKVKGQYSICILYRCSLVLATVGSNCGVYLVDAIIPLHGASVEGPNDGRGLQCHTASHTWKLVFLHQQRYYELMFSACSEDEEEIWTSQLRLRIAAEARDAAEGRHVCTDDVAHLVIDLKPIGPAFDVNINLVRRLSMRRAATLGPKAALRQVVIRNTHAQKPGLHEAEDFVQVSRSKSHMSATHTPTLAPRRSERVRLEGILADVWTRGSIPYPGIAMRRPENTIRASANSVMRKLSMASIASNFSTSKRTGSFSMSASHAAEIGRTPSPRILYNGANRSRRLEKRRSRAAVVDFHSAPNAFLPEDFELKKPTLTTRGQNFVRRAMTMDGNRAAPQLQVPLPSAPSQHKRSVSMSASATLRAPAPTPNESEDSGLIPNDRAATTLQMRLSENASPHPSVTSYKPQAKGKKRLFKLLGVHHGKD